MKNFLRWALYGPLNPEHIDEVQARQQRLLRYTQWLVFALISAFLLMAWVQWIPTRLIGLALGWLLALVGLVLVNWRPLTGAHISMLASTLAILVASCTNGGLGSVASAWLLYIPLIAGVMGGMALARVWIYVALVSMASLWTLSRMGVEFPDLTPEAFRSRQNTLQQFAQLIGVVLALTGLIGQVEASEKAMKSTIETLKEQVQARVVAEQKANTALARQQAFFTSMSHELRTPLNAIIGFARMLMQKKAGAPFTDRDQDAIRRIKTNGNDLLAMVNQLLEIRKNAQDQLLLHRQRICVSALVDQVCGDLSSLVPEEVTLRVESGPPLSLYTDAQLLHRILVNLVGNALKFTRKGSVTVRVESAQASLMVHVDDTGMGIAVEELGLIFEPFTRGVGRETENGSGLGLALCQQWAGMLGGKITVRSVVDQGSYFTLVLPLEHE